MCCTVDATEQVLLRVVFCAFLQSMDLCCREKCISSCVYKAVIQNEASKLLITPNEPGKTVG